MYMPRKYYATHKDQARRFAQASRKAKECLASHPHEALDIVMQYVDKNYIATNRVMQKLMLEDVLRLQVDRESKNREFRPHPDMGGWHQPLEEGDDLTILAIRRMNT